PSASRTSTRWTRSCRKWTTSRPAGPATNPKTSSLHVVRATSRRSFAQRIRRAAEPSAARASAGVGVVDVRPRARLLILAAAAFHLNDDAEPMGFGIEGEGLRRLPLAEAADLADQLAAVPFRLALDAGVLVLDLLAVCREARRVAVGA